MSTISFWNAVSFKNAESTALQKILETADAYLYLGGKRAIVLSGNTNPSIIFVQLEESQTSWISKIVKIASYFLFIIPLAALTIKYVLRNRYSFTIIKQNNLDDLFIKPAKPNISTPPLINRNSQSLSCQRFAPAAKKSNSVPKLFDMTGIFFYKEGDAVSKWKRLANYVYEKSLLLTAEEGYSILQPSWSIKEKLIAGAQKEVSKGPADGHLTLIKLNLFNDALEEEKKKSGGEIVSIDNEILFGKNHALLLRNLPYFPKLKIELIRDKNNFFSEKSYSIPAFNLISTEQIKNSASLEIGISHVLPRTQNANEPLLDPFFDLLSIPKEDMDKYLEKGSIIHLLLILHGAQFYENNFITEKVIHFIKAKTISSDQESQIIYEFLNSHIEQHFQYLIEELLFMKYIQYSFPDQFHLTLQKKENGIRLLLLNTTTTSNLDLIKINPILVNNYKLEVWINHFHFISKDDVAEMKKIGITQTSHLTVEALKKLRENNLNFKKIDVIAQLPKSLQNNIPFLRYLENTPGIVMYDLDESILMDNEESALKMVRQFTLNRDTWAGLPLSDRMLKHQPVLQEIIKTNRIDFFKKNSIIHENPKHALQFYLYHQNNKEKRDEILSAIGSPVQKDCEFFEKILPIDPAAIRYAHDSLHEELLEKFLDCYIQTIAETKVGSTVIDTKKLSSIELDKFKKVLENKKLTLILDECSFSTASDFNQLVKIGISLVSELTVEKLVENLALNKIEKLNLLPKSLQNNLNFLTALFRAKKSSIQDWSQSTIMDNGTLALEYVEMQKERPYLYASDRMAGHESVLKKFIETKRLEVFEQCSIINNNSEYAFQFYDFHKNNTIQREKILHSIGPNVKTDEEFFAKILAINKEIILQQASSEIQTKLKR
ncbi:MAG: DUF648 domain-containing protein [Chlamydia sp.]